MIMNRGRNNFWGWGSKCILNTKQLSFWQEAQFQISDPKIVEAKNTVRQFMNWTPPSIQHHDKPSSKLQLTCNNNVYMLSEESATNKMVLVWPWFHLLIAMSTINMCNINIRDKTTRCFATLEVFSAMLSCVFYTNVLPGGHAKIMSLQKSVYWNPPSPLLSHFVIFGSTPSPLCHSPKSGKFWRWILTILTSFICANQMISHGQNSKNFLWGCDVTFWLTTPPPCHTLSGF